VIRVVSETLESNGSSSMGSVCASSMALQAAGVPVSAPVAGVAMGLIKEGDDYIVLTDIAGVEDHLGDMDFKVAGTAEGITALQMDIKITGVTFDILATRCAQANKGRQFILGKMAEAIDGPREKLSQHAPRIESIKIDPEKIGAVIGKGGETIRALCEEFEARSTSRTTARCGSTRRPANWSKPAWLRIESMTKEAEVGDPLRTAKVVKTTTFGAFVELVKGTDGLPAHLQREAGGEGRLGRRRAQAPGRESTSPWSRSTASAAGSACASPTTPVEGKSPEEELRRRSGRRGPRPARPRRRGGRRGGDGGRGASGAASAA
jgi:polyribonucleotide nucleotidyltransferase